MQRLLRMYRQLDLRSLPLEPLVTSPATSEHLIREDLLLQLRNHFAQKVTMVNLDERPLPLRDQFP